MAKLMMCKMGAWLNTLDDQDRQQFYAWSGTSAELHRRCAQAGFTGRLTATKQHKKERCSCE